MAPWDSRCPTWLFSLPLQQLNRHFIRIVSEKGTRCNYGGNAPRLGLIHLSSHQNERRCSVGGQGVMSAFIRHFVPLKLYLR